MEQDPRPAPTDATPIGFPVWMLATAVVLTLAALPVLGWSAYGFYRASEGTELALAAVAAVLCLLVAVGAWVAVTRALARSRALLLAEVRDRRRAQEALRAAWGTLEQRVEERTRQAALHQVEAEAATAAAEMANEELSRLNKVKSEFVSIVSHEFRTALTGIQGFSEMMRDEDLTTAEIKEYAADINVDAQRLNRMITEMLDLDRMESGRMTLNREQVDLNALLRDAVERSDATSSNHTVEFDLDPSLPPLSADRDKLIQLFANLLSNAIKYSPDGGDVAVVSRFEKGGGQHVEVRDHGVGIPVDALEHVFERYSRVDGEENRDIQGTGLGLSIVRQIVRLHGGRVWAESTLGRGSTFHVVLR